MDNIRNGCMIRRVANSLQAKPNKFQLKPHRIDKDTEFWLCKNSVHVSDHEKSEKRRKQIIRSGIFFFHVEFGSYEFLNSIVFCKRGKNILFYFTFCTGTTKWRHWKKFEGGKFDSSKKYFESRIFLTLISIIQSPERLLSRNWSTAQVWGQAIWAYAHAQHVVAPYSWMTWSFFFSA